MKTTGQVLLGALAACSLMTGAANASSVTDALKDIKPSGGVCTTDRAPPAAPSKSPGTSATPDLNCALTVQQATTLIAETDALIVDTRWKNAYEAYRINGALNLPWSELQTKPFLKRRTILLTGDGKRDSELYRACADLKAFGFPQVHVLRGGMAAWAAQAQPAVGQAPDLATMALMSPSDLFRESKSGHVVVLLGPDARELKNEFPSSVQLDGVDAQSVSSALKRRQNRANPQGVLLVAGDRYDRSGLADTLEALKPTPMLVFAEPVSSYQTFLKSQQAMWAAHARGPKQPGCSL